MLWQNASARTRGHGAPVVVAGPPELEQGADRGRSLTLLAERREVVLPDQPLGRLVHGGQVEWPGQTSTWLRASGSTEPGWSAIR